MARSTKTAGGLTEKQERFCIEYVDNGGNASEAYRICYDCSNMQPQSVWRKASELLDNGKVRARIDGIKRERAKRADRGRELCNNALLDMIETNPDDLMYTDPHTGKTRMRTPQQLSRKAKNSIRKLTNNNGKVSFELHNKIDAIRTYASINGLVSAELNHSFSEGQTPQVRFVFGKRKGDDEDEK